MNRDSRLSGVLHVLLHMADRPGPATSEDLARIMQTNPVVVRRVMAGLRKRGVVRSERGHGGGWTLIRDPAEITLRDIYDGIGAPPLFAIGNRNAAPICAVERSVNAALDSTLKAAGTLLLKSFETVTLAKLRGGLRRELARRRPNGKESSRHDR